MPPLLRRFLSQPRPVPTLLALALLVFQCAMPWMQLDFVTQDGPSHLYTALVARDLLFNGNSPYAGVYEFQPKLTTNWSTTILMNLAALLFGPREAEHAIATLCVLLAFFGFNYLRRALNPEGPRWHPIANFLAFAWFLWIGYYNFYLGMAIAAFVVGYAIRHLEALNARRVAYLAAGCVLLFFTHVLPLALALLALGMLALWASVVHRPLRFRPLALMSAAVAPATVLLLIFIRASGQTTDFNPEIAWAWENFPMHAFASSVGRMGSQHFLVPGMLLFLVVGFLGMRRSEWASPRAPIFGVAAFSFVLYLLLPNSGFGGDDIKIRLVWAVFIFGCLAASTVQAMQGLNTAVALYIAAFLGPTLLHTLRTNVRPVGPATTAYLAAMERIPAGATFVRLRFPTPATRVRYGFDGVGAEPMFHADALAAARRGLVALSDYQALTGIFPIKLHSKVPDHMRYQLWDLEGSGSTGVDSLRSLLKSSPVPIDYVVVLGDQPPSERADVYKSVVGELDSTMRLLTGHQPNSFVRVYERIGPR